MARDFDGTSGRMEVASGFGLASSPLTIACWFNPDNQTSSNALVRIFASVSGDERYLQYSGDVANDPMRWVNVDVGVSSNTAERASSQIAAGSWFVVAGSASSNTVRRLTIGGAIGQAQDGDGSSVAPSGFDSFDIGSRGASSYLDGKMCEVAAWNVALTDIDRVSLRKGFPARRIRPQSLVFYARIIREVQDIRGGRAITVTGTTPAPHPRTYGL